MNNEQFDKLTVAPVELLNAAHFEKLNAAIPALAKNFRNPAKWCINKSLIILNYTKKN
jgi:hypothetical protein